LNGNKIFYLLLPVLLYGDGFNLNTQIKEDLSFITKSHHLEKKNNDINFHQAITTGSEYKALLLGFGRIYQLFLSSQDRSVCIFTVSCSRFGLSAVEKYGIFHGIMIASDRVQRCNGLGRIKYSLDLKSGLCIDFPISDYYIGRTKK